MQTELADLRNLNLVQKLTVLFENARHSVVLAWQASPRFFLLRMAFVVGNSLLPAVQVLLAREVVNAISADNVDLAVQWLVIGAALIIFQAMLNYGGQFITRRFDDMLRLMIANRLFAQAERHDLATFDSPVALDALERARQNIAMHISRFFISITQLTTRALEVLGLGIVLIVIDPLLVMVGVPLLVPYIWFYWNQSQAIYLLEFNRTAQRRLLNYFAELMLGRDSVAEVKLLGLGPLLRERYNREAESIIAANRKLYIRQYLGGFLISTAVAVGFIVAIGWVLWRTMLGTLSIGNVVLYIGAALRLRANLEWVGPALTDALEDALFVRDFRRFMEADPRIDQQKGAALPPIEGEIRFEDVSFNYPGSPVAVLHNLNITIPAGQVVAIVGENGAGKSTFIKLLARLYDPTNGQISIDGHDLRNIAPASLYTQLAVVMQNFNRYEATLHDNIAFANWQTLLENKAEVAEIAEQAQLHDLIAGLPKGLETQLGRRFGDVDLSGGQWQRLALARAFARPARLLILDEPTANVDARAEYHLFQQFRALAQGRTAILISHRFSTVSLADRIIVLDNGRIIEDGSHEVLINQNGQYAELYRLHRWQMEHLETPATNGLKTS